MFTFLITLAIIVALFLVLVVLIQNSYEGGLSSQFGGAGVTQLIGVKKNRQLARKNYMGPGHYLICAYSYCSYFSIAKSQPR